MRSLILSLVVSSIALLGNSCNGDMSTDRLVELAAEHGSVEGVLANLPLHMRKNYTLMEKSGGLQPASLEHPRLIHFGSDARFILAVSTDPSDPQREVIEFTELDRESGNWRFRTLDLRSVPAKMDEPSLCRSCHGEAVTRPIWGSYPSWPGAFGPTDRPMPAYQAVRLNRMQSEGRDRFGHLVFMERPHRPGADIFSLPERAYKYSNIVFNFELGASVAEGMFIKMKNHPLYPKLREGFFLLRTSCASRRSPAHDRLQQALEAAGVGRARLEDLYKLLGVSMRDLAMNLKATDPNPSWQDSRWSSGESRIQDFIEFLVLDDLVTDLPELQGVLEATRQGRYGIRGATNLEENRRYRLLHQYVLTGTRRQASRAQDGLSLGRVGQGVLRQAEARVCRYLMDR